MSVDKQVFEELAGLVKDQTGFEVRYKTDSRLQKILGKVLFFNPRYLTTVTTTMLGGVYFPSRAFVESDYRSAWRILAHEYIHALDNRTYGPVRFGLGYVFPQILGLGALGAIGAFWCSWALLCLGFLAALAPWLCVRPQGFRGNLGFT